MKKTHQSGFIEGLAMILGLVASITLLSLNSARAKSRDAQRLSHIRMIASSLELYYNDHSTYPENIASTTPIYIGSVPTPPRPQDGNCTIEQNEYSYIKVSKDEYEFTFCLGQDTGGYPKGLRTLTPFGIK